MRDATAWAKMYDTHVASLSFEEIEAFVAAIQLDAIRELPTTEDVAHLMKLAGTYPDDLFIE